MTDKKDFLTTRYFVKETEQFLLLLSVCYVEDWISPFNNCRQRGFVISCYYISPFDIIENKGTSCATNIPSLETFYEIDAAIAEECLSLLYDFHELIGWKVGSIKGVDYDTGYYIDELPQSGKIRSHGAVLYKNHSISKTTPIIINHRSEGKFECIDLGYVSTRICIFDKSNINGYVSNISADDYNDIKNICCKYMFKIFSKLALVYSDKVLIRPIF